jgi:hypothetical protein
MKTVRKPQQVGVKPQIWRAADLSFRVELDGGVVLARDIPTFYEARRFANTIEPEMVRHLGAQVAWAIDQA